MNVMPMEVIQNLISFKLLRVQSQTQQTKNLSGQNISDIFYPVYVTRLSLAQTIELQISLLQETLNWQGCKRERRKSNVRYNSK